MRIAISDLLFLKGREGGWPSPIYLKGRRTAISHLIKVHEDDNLSSTLSQGEGGWPLPIYLKGGRMATSQIMQVDEDGNLSSTLSA